MFTHCVQEEPANKYNYFYARYWVAGRKMSDGLPLRAGGFAQAPQNRLLKKLLFFSNWLKMTAIFSDTRRGSPSLIFLKF